MFQKKTKPVDAGLLPTWAEVGLTLFPEGSPESQDFTANLEINSKIVLYPRGDITSLKIDAIVCPANGQLMPGGGLGGMIHMRAGPGLAAECAAIGRVAPGTVVVTGGYDLNAHRVIHAVGPVGHKPEMLEQTYRSVFGELGEEIRSVAIPPISTGVSGFPGEEAAEIALRETRKFCEDSAEAYDRIVFVFDDAEQCEMYNKLMAQYFPVSLPSVTESLVGEDSSLCEEEEEEEEDVIEPKQFTF